MSTTEDYQTYKLGNFKLKSGGEIPDAVIAYKTLGDPSLPAIIYPTWYSGKGVKSALYAALGTSSAGVAKPDVHTVRARGGLPSFTPDQKKTGLKALGRVYAGWGFSQAFYREKLYEKAPTLGFKDLDDFLVNFWEAWALSKDPENMLIMALTWQAGDCSQQEPYNGDFKKAMEGIKAKTLVLPAKTDLYFPPEDSEIEVQNMKSGVGTLKVFPSIWGHWAGGPGQSTEDVKWLDDNLREFFASN
ncbi:hypothetical protein N0V83_003438 [Neocucurbitaria cava]|uniref:Uncharacterized protein n=1 Tax=Neocucurbitaria cava TaxID=798079 RepID=A0A9W8YBV0_9PLEO|nr:hypothetical protein N0V83_003438 [Neocucurbitaria cava]